MEKHQSYFKPTFGLYGSGQASTLLLAHNAFRGRLQPFTVNEFWAGGSRQIKLQKEAKADGDTKQDADEWIEADDERRSFVPSSYWQVGVLPLEQVETVRFEDDEKCAAIFASRRNVRGAQDEEDACQMFLAASKSPPRRQDLQATMTKAGRRPIGEAPMRPWTTILREQFLDARLSALFLETRKKRRKHKIFGANC